MQVIGGGMPYGGMGFEPMGPSFGFQPIGPSFVFEPAGIKTQFGQQIKVMEQPTSIVAPMLFTQSQPTRLLRNWVRRHG